MNTVYTFYIKHTEKLPAEIFQQFLLQLPGHFQQEINAYKHWENAQASLLGKIILLYGFKQLDIKNSLHDIRIDKKDRPFLPLQEESTDLSTIDFNISHSGDYVIAAISKKRKVGVDIEKFRTLKMDIADKYFDAAECREMDAAADPQQAFFELWSVKESAIKCDGRGVEVLAKTHVVLDENRPFLSADTVNCDGKRFHFQRVEIEQEYSCCVCSDAVFDIKLTKLSLPDLQGIWIN